MPTFLKTLNWGGAFGAIAVILSTQPVLAPGTIAAVLLAFLSALGGHAASAPAK